MEGYLKIKGVNYSYTQHGHIFKYLKVKGSLTQKNRYCMIPFVYNFCKCKLIYGDRKRMSACLGWCSKRKLG